MQGITVLFVFVFYSYFDYDFPKIVILPFFPNRYETIYTWIRLLFWKYKDLKKYWCENLKVQNLIYFLFKNAIKLWNGKAMKEM